MIATGEKIQVFIPHTPIAKARPRFNRATGRPYTPKTTHDYEQFVAECLRREFPDYKTFEGHCHLDVRFLMPIPKSKRFRYHRGECALNKSWNSLVVPAVTLAETPYKPCVRCKPEAVAFYEPIYPTGKPDLDNLEKAVMDGLEKSEIIKDDKQIVSKWSIKEYSETPGVLIGLTFGGRL